MSGGDLSDARGDERSEDRACDRLAASLQEGHVHAQRRVERARGANVFDSSIARFSILCKEVSPPSEKHAESMCRAYGFRQ